ncbi:MAG: ABC transporter permease subunit [Spirochaetes bacterium]|uniref:ABC transporter permease subunit n=1 Tax=Candidatus Avitreponema avistercoris TaxID=2840705 RepID=A0A9D9ENT9_9SPIR|nr:ABC transporter permease subunit [Candidatus Avitreponema avistercoris]
MRSHALVIARRETGAYFSGPMVYIVTGLFLVFSGFLFFSTFFLLNRAELRSFFSLLPVLFSFFIPALTMRLFAEETRSGSFETLVTLPVSAAEIVLGKFLAGWLSACTLLAPTLVYAATAAFFGDLDPGPVVGGYLGAVLLASAFSAAGIFASSLTRNQIIAFFTAFAVCIVLTMIDQAAVFLPSGFADAAAFLSASAHFSSVSRGIIDSRDLVYFFSLTALFFVLAVRTVERGRAK